MGHFDPPEPDYDNDDLYEEEKRRRDDGCHECGGDYIRGKNTDGTDSEDCEWFENEEKHECLKCSQCGNLYDLVEGFYAYQEYLSESRYDNF